MSSGRQALWIVYDECRVDQRKNLLYGIRELMTVSCDDPSDTKKLRQFFNRWNVMVIGLKAPWNTDSAENLKTKEQLFHAQVEKSKLIAGALNAYDVADDWSSKETVMISRML